jgi:hypothetical protein
VGAFVLADSRSTCGWNSARREDGNSDLTGKRTRESPSSHSAQPHRPIGTRLSYAVSTTRLPGTSGAEFHRRAPAGPISCTSRGSVWRGNPCSRANRPPYPISRLCARKAAPVAAQRTQRFGPPSPLAGPANRGIGVVASRVHDRRNAPGPCV